MKLSQLSSHTYLIKELAKREVFSRYQGSLLGIWWAVLTPLATLAVFSFVFGEIFQSRWHGGSGNILEFSVRLYAGLVVFWFFSEIITKSPSLVISQPNFVTKVVFPLEILPIVSVIGSVFHLGINLGILLLSATLLYGKIHLAYFAIPLVALSTIPMLLGFGWILAAFGVYVRDVSTVVGVAISMLMFLSPIFYPIDAVPQGVRWLFELNPMSLPIEWIRSSACDGLWPQWSKLAIYSLISLVIGALGWHTFGTLKKGFADVL